ncbi:MAG: hypothetical protein A2Y25_02425 [Candidatus Melainabacteria bacterium GWF2_37_15]|nr:MAG: hypothetical protein A2Y25_02425 [Candidatus Melainabacteria bacterium GWF2_37_15]
MIISFKCKETEKIFDGGISKKLKGNLQDYCSIRINDQYRLVFKFENGNAENIYIADYHK